MLYVVATPIGNLADISKRAVDVLSSVALIAAEDTRRCQSLLSALGIARPEIIALHDHNEAAASRSVLAALAQGARVALVSDAGTPLLSDPGFVLVRDCYERGIAVRPVPGPSALSAALSVCPLPVGGCRFVGFLPARDLARRAKLTELLESGQTLVFFEAPHRFRDCLMDLRDLAPRRRLFVAREMTKRFETYLCAEPERLIEQMDASDQWRGELVCVLEGVAEPASADERELQRVMQILAAELPPTQAAKVGARLLGRKRSELYELVQRLKGRPRSG